MCCGGSAWGHTYPDGRGRRGDSACHLAGGPSAARIDRLEPDAKRTLNAAAVVGSRFRPRAARPPWAIDPALADLLTAQLIDQVRFTPRTEFAFRHPLIRAVAYESQLKSDRARLHRRLAATIESG